MKIVFFTFYYPPDLCAGSFRAIALAQALSERMKDDDELHIITTHPNRYENHRVKADNVEIHGNITVHRITVPSHKSGMLSQARTFITYALASYKLSNNLNPDFLIGTTSRLMTGVLTGISARKLGCKYFIDLRDIFSETLSDILSQKSKLLGFASKTTFSLLERWLFNRAIGVNVVSKGFPEYFQTKGVDTYNWSFFPNGVDKEFVNLPCMENKNSKNIKTILYAGNIGSGQGLETVLPATAKNMSGKYHFLVIGDGGARSKLINVIKKENINNIEILPPVKRDELIAYYQDADILFLHLNDLPAFKRVLPSKIFEYTALGKPIVAGLGGYSAQFMVDNVPNSIVFAPGDVEGCVDAIRKIEKLDIKSETTDVFVKKYSREKIMDRMAGHIFSVL
ncbi:glycosyltransferase family 4 protein [Candidatus Thioglobus sp. NP1]|uniref:glycosyltransferase family 4 protein n=1 Tax=Candidatus Thioglobus sp. NP1 TaxID=2508687 RepID=UPI000DEDEBD0|nr:glycosyltransferase family 4 protein [Candidatus Thioglobus sp. NP1]AXE61731.1 glycosyltransferase WbuB [Candidatus Thioglobus sp. NP1]